MSAGLNRMKIHTGAARKRRPRILVSGAFLDRKLRPIRHSYAASSARTISQMPVTPRHI